MSEKSATPDLLPRFNRPCHLDKAEHGTIGHHMEPVVKGACDIARSPQGRKDPMDSNKSTGGKSFESSLGAEESGTSTDLRSGARAPKANWNVLRRG